MCLCKFARKFLPLNSLCFVSAQQIPFHLTERDNDFQSAEDTNLSSKFISIHDVKTAGKQRSRSLKSNLRTSFSVGDVGLIPI